MYSVTTNVPTTLRIKIFNPDPDKGQPRIYITTSAWKAWMKFQYGCTIFLLDGARERQIDYKLLMHFGAREFRKMVPDIEENRAAHLRYQLKITHDQENALG